MSMEQWCNDNDSGRRSYSDKILYSSDTSFTSKPVEEYTHFKFSNLPEIVPFMIQCEKKGTARQATDYNRKRQRKVAICMPDN
jgi:hypothetical protein